MEGEDYTHPVESTQDSNTPQLPIRPLPSLKRAYKYTHSALHSSAVSSSSRSITVREEVQQLYKSEELPSIYRPETFVVPWDIAFLDGASLEDVHETGFDVLKRQADLDVNSPLNWPSKKKLLNMFCIFLMCIISPFASSVFAPAIPDLMREFGATDPYLSSFVLSIYILGYAVGPLLISPLSELFGRAPLYHSCNTLFSICTILCGRTNSLRSLAAARFLAGVGGSSVFALAPSSIADMIPEEKRGAVMAIVAMGYNLGPSVSPTAGSYINSSWGWRWIFYITGGIGLVFTLLNYVGLSESHKPVLLHQQAARSREQKRSQTTTMQPRYGFAEHATMLSLLGRAMMMPLRLLFFSRAIFLTSFLTAVAYGWMYMLYSTIPRTFLDIYAWPAKNIGLAYLSTAVGALLGMLAGAIISDSVVYRRKRNGDNRPENRLLPMCFFWPLVSAGLVVYAWTAQNNIHWAAPLFGACVFGAGAMSSMFFVGTYIIDAYPVHSASGTAASILFRSLLGGLTLIFSNKLYIQLDVGWTFSLLAFIALMFAPAPWVVYRFGEQWRKKEGLNEGCELDGRSDLSQGCKASCNDLSEYGDEGEKWSVYY